MKSINISGYCEFMSASSQNQIAPNDQVTIFLKHSVIFNAGHPRTFNASCNSKSVTIALHEVRMKVYGVLFNGLFTLN